MDNFFAVDPPCQIAQPCVSVSARFANTSGELAATTRKLGVTPTGGYRHRVLEGQWERTPSCEALRDALPEESLATLSC